MPKKDIVEAFSKSLEDMHERCGSCRHLEYDKGTGYCSVHNIERDKKDRKCEHWRYFA